VVKKMSYANAVLKDKENQLNKLKKIEETEHNDFYHMEIAYLQKDVDFYKKLLGIK
jgi:hypothetical protein